MELKILNDNQVEKIKERLPDEAVTQHPTKTYLSSIKPIYVLERLNEVFGIGSWTIKTEQIGTGNDKGMVIVKVTFEIPSYGIYYECFGGNDNGGDTNKNFDLGDAYKGATTDAITKICSYMGIGMDVFKGKHKGGAGPSMPQKKQTVTTPTTKGEIVDGKCSKCGSASITSAKGNEYCVCWYN